MIQLKNAQFTGINEAGKELIKIKNRCGTEHTQICCGSTYSTSASPLSASVVVALIGNISAMAET